MDQRIGFLGRLARDVRGNTLALMAAALIPMAGLIGGGVDMSRLYLVKTRLQEACDAGALAGRKAMAAGSWTTGSGSTNDKAEKMFDANFSSGQYGSGTRVRSYAESNGTVTGSATVPVPMTIMKVFGMTTRALSVTCQAKMELPNTDVMFVLDMTASMQDLPSCATEYCGNGVNGQRRIDGLKKAVKCFYEALEKVSTPEPCTYVSGTTYNSTADPTATTATMTAQVRIGFVPYGVNVNVGKLLPNAVMADNWVYQSRVANAYAVNAPRYGWTTGTESAVGGWSGWSPNSTPSSFNTSSGFSSFATPASDVTVNSVLYVQKRTDISSSTNCDSTGLNTLSGSSNTLIAREDLPGTTSMAVTSSTTPTNPQNTQTLTYTDTDPRVVNGYRYKWKKNGFSSNACWLEKGTGSYNRTRTGTSTKPVTWTQYDGVWDGTYTYKPVLEPVSGLKAGGSTWNTSVAIPNIGLSDGATVYLSGQSSPTTLQYPASATVTWDGCIEEARTFQNTDGTPSDDWNTLPSTAYDMNVNLIPNGSSTNPAWGSPVASTIPWLTANSTTSFGPGTFWGPMLAKTTSSTTTPAGAVWARYTGTTASSNWTQNAVTTSTWLSQNNYKYICTTSEARKLTEYRTNTNFLSYVNALDAQDIGTYHDIGMLWGARFISPLGIFASENATAATGGAIQRHLIFMTDGGTNTVYNNYNAYGLSFYNRYQFSADVSSTAGETSTDDVLNARMINICNQVKNMNITLWVVSYGASVNTTTQDRLRSCATDANHFFNSTDTPTLLANFKTIAAKISALRLTG
jgi:Flp pilus assembly protein TadG